LRREIGRKTNVIQSDAGGVRCRESIQIAEIPENLQLSGKMAPETGDRCGARTSISLSLKDKFAPIFLGAVEID